MFSFPYSFFLIPFSYVFLFPFSYVFFSLFLFPYSIFFFPYRGDQYMSLEIGFDTIVLLIATII